MPNYVAKALQSFHHRPPIKLEHQPYPHVKPTYGAMMQYAKVEDAFDEAGKKVHSRSMWSVPISSSSNQQWSTPSTMCASVTTSKPNQKNMTLCKKFLNYMASQDKAILTYRASDMVLAIPSKHHTYWKQMQGVGQVDICS
jgi:hypothetical protein